MGGPWGKYAQADSGNEAASGPWTKYQAPAQPSGPSQTQSALRGFASGVTGSFDDEMIGGMDAFGRALGIKNLGSAQHLSELQTANPTLDRQTLLDAYRQGRDTIRAQQAQDMATNPKTTIAGNLAGAFASPISRLGPQGAGLGNAMKAAALQGGVYGAGASNADLTQGQVGQFAKDTATGMAIGAAVPPVLKGAGYLAGKGVDLAKAGGSKLLSFIGGANPDAIQEYAKFSNRINSAPNEAALKQISDEFVGKLASDVDSAKLTAEQAQDAFKGFQADLKDAYRTAGYDARDAVTSAQQTLKDAHGARLQQMAGDIYDSVNQLKSDVQEGSKSALKTLDKAQGKVDLAPVYSKMDETIDRLKQAGTDESLAVADKVQAYKERLMSKNWSNIFAPDAKRLIQGLDQVTEYSPMAGSFDKAKNAAFKGIRSALDQQVKSAVPEYAAAMEPVAENAKLLERVGSFGDKQSAVGLLQRVNAPNQLENRAALQQLGQKYGTDFIAGAQPENLPEYGLLQKAQAAQEALRPDRVAEKIDQTLAASRQKAALDTAQSGLQGAQDRLAPFKSLAPNAAGQTQVQSKLTQLAKGKNIELEGMFRELGKLTNTDFVQAMHDQNVLAAFQKGATNGSRNTFMGAALGWAIGGMTGGAIGASAGRAVDQWGPAITKKILDGAIKVSRSPTVETIAGLDLPAPIRQNMVIGLRNYLAKLPAEAGTQLPAVAERSEPNRSPSKSPGGKK